MASAIRSTTWSSLAWAEARRAIRSCSPVRISRADVAALSGMPQRYQKRCAAVTRVSGLIGDRTVVAAVGVGALALRELDQLARLANNLPAGLNPLAQIEAGVVEVV